METGLIKKLKKHLLNKGVAFRAARRVVREALGATPSSKTVRRELSAKVKYFRTTGAYNLPKDTERRQVLSAHRKRRGLRSIARRVREEGELPYLAEQATAKERALQPAAMTGAGVARTLTRKEVVDKYRDLMCKVNRAMTDLEERYVSQTLVSPPYKGTEPRSYDNNYPPQLMGIRSGSTDKQKIRIGGTANQGSGYGGPVGFYGSPTGGSYAT